jgi:hypothetical protein
MRRLHKFNRDHPMVLRLLVSVVFYTLLGVALWWFISPGTTTHRKDFALLIAQIAGGAALLFGLYFTWRKVEISQRTLETQQDQQVIERFTRAIDQLGATDDQGKRKLEIRLGGIYALERIARDSPERDYMTVMEVLTAYIRENAPWDKAPWPQPTQKPPLPADIQEILRVLARREESRVPKEYRVPLDLQKTNLSGVEFRRVNLKRVNLSAANLSAADLLGTDLEGAELWDADLHHANLERANLERASLEGANLERADLDGANLKRAHLHDANLKGAVFGFGSYPPGENR